MASAIGVWPGAPWGPVKPVGKSGRGNGNVRWRQPESLEIFLSTSQSPAFFPSYFSPQFLLDTARTALTMLYTMFA